MKHLSELDSWKALEKHAQSIHLETIQALWSESNVRHKEFSAIANTIHLDFSNQRVNHLTLKLLSDLANEHNLREKILAMINGAYVNQSEKKPALHTALRSFHDRPLFIDGHDIIPDILATLDEIRRISNQIRAGEWHGSTGKRIKAIVNIGMGGSDLGPRFCIKALADFITHDLSYHFISDADPNAFKNTVAMLDPETTLFIISSKSFKTKETLYNLKKAFSWLNALRFSDRHFIAVTANKVQAEQLGIKHILPIWDWVGGRYSLCSAINLITAIAIGFDPFSQFLAGANLMDLHFRDTPLTQNIPILLALLGIWNNNFLHTHNLLILTYAQQLEDFVPHIQQLDMESNGKSIDNQGRAVNYATGPIVWGGLGNRAQHSYYQLLCQGTHKIAVDLISINTFDHEMINKMCLAKKQILTNGVIESSNPNGYVPGNTPLNHLSLSECSPTSIGSLIALYEHKIFVQGVIWNINPFDQPGVESTKRINTTTSLHSKSNDETVTIS